MRFDDGDERARRMIDEAKREAKRLTTAGKKYGGAIENNMKAIKLLNDTAKPYYTEMANMEKISHTLAKQCAGIFDAFKKGGMDDKNAVMMTKKAVEKLEKEVEAAARKFNDQQDKFMDIILKIEKLTQNTMQYLKNQLKQGGRTCPFCDGKGHMKSLSPEKEQQFKQMLIELQGILNKF